MDYDSLIKKLKQLKTEDFIWVIYIFIIFMSWYGNSLERKYFIYNDIESGKKYRRILIFTFSILIFIYIYFLKDSYSDIKDLKPYDSSEKKNLTVLSFIGSLFIVISGVIFLYIAIKDEEINVELAFN